MTNHNEKMATRDGVREYTLPPEIVELASKTHVTLPLSKTAVTIFKTVMILFFVNMTCLPFVLIFSPDTADKAGDIWFLLLILFLFGAIPLKIILKNKKAYNPAIAYITPEEIRVEHPGKGGGRLVEWKNVVATSAALYDVFLETKGKSVTPFIRPPEQWSYFELVGKRYFYRSLNTKDIPPIAFTNQWEINRAILANFAVNTKHQLVFDADMFIRLQIDPITWKRARRPKYQRDFFILLSMAVMMCLIFCGPDGFWETDGFFSFTGRIIAALLVIVVPFALLDFRLIANHSPQFAYGGIAFKRPTDVD